MLTKNKEKIIKSLHTKKSRLKHELCLVEGSKVIKMADKYLEYSFTNKDTSNFKKLLTTQAPQSIAGVAKIPKFNKENVISKDIIVILDNVQDPGNVGNILRLCLGFNSSLILMDSADVTNSKVIRSSVGAMFKVPWIKMSENKIKELVKETKYNVYKLEKVKKAKDINDIKIKKPLFLVLGSEGQGIKIKIKGDSLYINHNKELESLNVSNALAIALNTIKK